MNKIKINENFKNEKLPLLFNINYEGNNALNENKDYLYILDRYFSGIEQNTSVYELAKCIVTIFSLDEDSNLNLNIYNNSEKVLELFSKNNNVLSPFMKAKKGSGLLVLSNDGTIFNYDTKSFFKVNNEPFCFYHLEKFGDIGNDFLHMQFLAPFELDYDIKRYIKFFIEITNTYPYFDDKEINLKSLMLFLMQYYKSFKYCNETNYLIEMVNNYLYLFGKVDVSDIPRFYDFKEYDLARKLIPSYMKKDLSKTTIIK